MAHENVEYACAKKMPADTGPFLQEKRLFNGRRDRS
jgi:hypothetical protein